MLLWACSPEVRGAERLACYLPDQQRIIPADAGSTPAHDVQGDMSEDHPRRCGEHKNTKVVDFADWGSSPQMRGAPGARHSELADLGIIPADAGSTSTPAWPMLPRWDHPRRCGEHIVDNFPTILKAGSSPQMRGAREYFIKYYPTNGIIPADAGSTPRYGYN